MLSAIFTFVKSHWKAILISIGIFIVVCLAFFITDKLHRNERQRITTELQSTIDNLTNTISEQDAIIKELRETNSELRDIARERDSIESEREAIESGRKDYLQEAGDSVRGLTSIEGSGEEAIKSLGEIHRELTRRSE